MPRVSYKRIRDSARRCKRLGLNPAEHAPPYGRLYDVFMDEYNKVADPPVGPRRVQPT